MNRGYLRSLPVPPVPPVSLPAWATTAAVPAPPAQPTSPKGPTDNRPAAVASPDVAELAVLMQTREYGQNAPPDPGSGPAEPAAWEDGIPIETVLPCPRCGSYELWQTLLGEWRCMHCDAAAFRRSQRLRERAARQRRTGRRAVAAGA